MIGTDRRLRVVIAGQTPPPIGGQNIAIARTLEALGTSPHLRCEHLDFRFTPSWNEARQGGLRKILEMGRVYRRLARLRLAGRIDHIVIPAGGPHLAPILRDILLLPVARLFCRTVTLHFHAAGLARQWALLPASARTGLRLASRLVSGALVLTEYGRADADVLGIRRVTVLANGLADCDKQFLKSRPEVATFRDPIIFHAGHLCPDKGTLALIEACGVLHSEGRRFRLRLAGECLSPLTRDELCRWIGACGMDAHTEMLDLLSGDALLQAYADADLFAFPTVAPYESFGLVMVEAMRAGLPVLATDWRANAEVLGFPPGGVLCPTEGILSDNLARGLRTALDYRSSWPNWGERNRARFLERYRMEHYRQHLEAYLLSRGKTK